MTNVMAETERVIKFTGDITEEKKKKFIQINLKID